MSSENPFVGLPTNWNRWGETDEIGALNFLGQQEVLRGLRSVKQGKVFTLSLVIGSPSGEPTSPHRSRSLKFMTRDKGTFLANKMERHGGVGESADDFIVMYLHGSTHIDALGHFWYGEKLWNGYDAKTTIGGLQRDSILPIAEHGIVGSAVLLDIARDRGKKYLSPGEPIEVEDIEKCASKNGFDIQPHDIILIRTGWLTFFFEKGAQEFYKNLNGPGLVFSPKLVKWFHEMEIPLLGTDTIANEIGIDPQTGKELFPLHCVLMRDLGVLFNELLWLDALALDCESDGQYRFLYAAAPLKIHEGTGGPVNPIAIK